MCFCALAALGFYSVDFGYVSVLLAVEALHGAKPRLEELCRFDFVTPHYPFVIALSVDSASSNHRINDPSDFPRIDDFFSHAVFCILMPCRYKAFAC